MTSAPIYDLNRLVGTWKLDPEGSSVSFRTRAALVIRASGSLRVTDATVTVAKDGQVDGDLTIDSASIDSGIKRRDTHLRSADFFDVTNYGVISIAISSAQAIAGNSFQVQGVLTVLARSTPISLPVTIETYGESVKVTGELVIAKHHLGMKKAAATKSRVRLLATFIRA